MARLVIAILALMLILFASLGQSEDPPAKELPPGSPPESKVASEVWIPPDELMGISFSPPKERILEGGIADWGHLHLEDGEVKEVRLMGFAQYTKGRPINVASKDTFVLRLMESAGWTATRKCVSDVATPVGASGCCIGQLGLLQVKLKDETFIIGVSTECFYLDRWYGSDRSRFYCWGLAKLVDEILHNETGKHLEAEVFAELSGEARLQRSKKDFEEICEKFK
jgi:hypothetical protein